MDKFYQIEKNYLNEFIYYLKTNDFLKNGHNPTLKALKIQVEEHKI